MIEDRSGVEVTTRFRLVKWDGDPPRPGENKVPLEIIEGGDGIPTRVLKPPFGEKYAPN